jgi:citrate lyase synthetase
MLSFKELLLEQEEIIDKKTEADKQNNEADENKKMKMQPSKVLLVTGRFQPFHLAHKLIIEKSIQKVSPSKTIIGVVVGKKSSLDKTKNPFNLSYTKQIIKKIFPSVEIIELSNSYLPTIILDLRKKGFEVEAIVSGDDRTKEYNTQFKYFEKLKEKNPQFDIPKIRYISVNRKSKLTQNISGTKIRKALQKNDITTFNKMMPKKLHDQFSIMQKMIPKEVIK